MAGGKRKIKALAVPALGWLNKVISTIVLILTTVGTTLGRNNTDEIKTNFDCAWRSHGNWASVS
jgi:hypothetical protein